MMKFTVLLSLALFLSACSGEKPDRGGDSSVVEGETPPATLAGTVRFVNVEGGCWKIEGDDGKNYEPVGSSQEIQFEWVDGQRVEFTFRPAEGIGTFCQVGAPIYLEKITPLKDTE